MVAMVPVNGFRRFRSRLIVFLFLLMLPILAGIYLFVVRNNNVYTEQMINSYLESGAGVFDYTLSQQSQTLVAILSSLTWDFGFRTTFGAGDVATLFDASLNVLDRSLGSVDMLMIVDMNGEVIIDTALQGFERLSGEWKRLLWSADSRVDGIAEAVISVHDIPHRLIAVPLYLPRQVAWIIGGYPLDLGVLDRVKRITLSDVSLVRISQGTSQVLTSTLPGSLWNSLAANYDTTAAGSTDPQQIYLDGEPYGTLTRVLGPSGDAGGQLVALVHRSYQENQAIEENFQRFLRRFYLAVLVVSILAVLFLSRSVTRPVLKLVGLVQNIEKGDFSATANLNNRDEFGQLANSINSMARGLAEKEKVRDLLGKVVSPEIADQLLRKPVHLDGEERIVTIMYVDIKGFTSYCESRSPRHVLKVLNRYLSDIAGQIEANSGVVDKFMGDGVMALYGAPIQQADDVENALQTALMIKRQWQHPGGRRSDSQAEESLVTCIGIHTGLVVAGNLGSDSRLNYSVVGDSVNLAARLESLTRYYGVACIVSEQTAALADGFLYRELDQVRVVGRRDPVRIFELVGKLHQVTDKEITDTRQFSAFLRAYRSRNWDRAEAMLKALVADGNPGRLYSLYAERIVYFRQNPPGPCWQGVFVFDKK